jgi:hypothetical protein
MIAIGFETPASSTSHSTSAFSSPRAHNRTVVDDADDACDLTAVIDELL